MHIRKKDFFVFADECEIPKVSAEKMIAKIVSLRSKYQELCEGSLLLPHLKERFSELIDARCDVQALKLLHINQVCILQTDERGGLRTHTASFRITLFLQTMRQSGI